jgi:hypothetical protein
MVRYIVLSLVLCLILGGCVSQAAPSTQPFKVQQLRIVNSGSYDIDNLVVKFPDDKISFGNVPAGDTTEYMEVPNGVFGYAAYSFQVEGEVKSQAVMDWMGEVPMDGNLFTYTLDYDFSRTGDQPGFEMGDWIRLVDVTKDD